MTGQLRTSVIVIGAGHSGLAMSRCLAERSIDHVILERGEVANTWKTERWDSLRLLTPNWQCRLPGYAYDGPDPDNFMTVREVVSFIGDYADHIAAPIETSTAVTAVRQTSQGYEISTSQGRLQCKALVLASGACNLPNIPALGAKLPDNIISLSPRDYRSPETLTEGGIMVVGASATGIQLAREIHQSGRPVTISVGEHVRLPRVYRGRDIQWWMDSAGILDIDYKEVDDLVRARNVPSPQLIGSTSRETLDLNALSTLGVRIVGRLAGIQGSKAQFSGSLRNQCKLADLKMNRLLNTIDEWADANGIEDSEPHRFDATRIDALPPLEVDFARENIQTVLWATGFRPDYSWLDVPIFDYKGRIRHDGGIVTDAPGMYLMGLSFMRRWKSSFIHGAGDDARDLSEHLQAYINS